MIERLNYVPDDFYATFDYLWICKEDKNGRKRVYKRKKTRKGQIHAMVWGEEAWDICERGYYNSKLGIISCHVTLPERIRRQVIKKFPDAVKIRG